MYIQEFGYIFLYLSAFGFSDFIVSYYQFNNTIYLLYYSSIAFTGGTILYFSKYRNNQNISADYLISEDYIPIVEPEPEPQNRESTETECEI